MQHRDEQSHGTPELNHDNEPQKFHPSRTLLYEIFVEFQIVDLVLCPFLSRQQLLDVVPQESYEERAGTSDIAWSVRELYYRGLNDYQYYFGGSLL